MEQRVEPEFRTVFLSWKAPARLFKKRDKEFFRNIAAIIFFILVILVFARDYALMLAVLAVSFLVYVFSTIPPEEVENAVTNQGIENAGRLYPWKTLKMFWFEEQWGQHLIVFGEEKGSKLIVLLADISQEKIKEICEKYTRYEKEPQKTLLDSAATWLSQKVPLENPS